MKKLTFILSTLNLIAAFMLMNASDNDKLILYFVLSLAFWLGIAFFLIVRKIVNWLSR